MEWEHGSMWEHGSSQAKIPRFIDVDYDLLCGGGEKRERREKKTHTHAFFSSFFFFLRLMCGANSIFQCVPFIRRCLM